MKSAAFLLLVLSICAADMVDIGVVSETEGIAIRGCHPGDRVLVEVTPEHPGPTRVGGMFVTTNLLLTLNDGPMTMAPTGTNVARIRTICGGVTGAVREVRFVIRRPVPAPLVGRGKKFEEVTPPFPMLTSMPLPDADAMRRFEAARAGKRRGQ